MLRHSVNTDLLVHLVWIGLPRFCLVLDSMMMLLPSSSLKDKYHFLCYIYIYMHMFVRSMVSGDLGCGKMVGVACGSGSFCA